MKKSSTMKIELVLLDLLYEDELEIKEGVNWKLRALFSGRKQKEDGRTFGFERERILREDDEYPRTGD